MALAVLDPPRSVGTLSPFVISTPRDDRLNQVPSARISTGHAVRRQSIPMNSGWSGSASRNTEPLAAVVGASEDERPGPAGPFGWRRRGTRHPESPARRWR